jgi:V/A-type H+-transporting ATPase subunit I
MKLATVVGPLRDFDAVVLDCIVGHEFHPESALSTMKMVKGLHPLDPENPYLDRLRRVERLLALLDIKAVKGTGGAPSSDGIITDERLMELEAGVDALLAEREDRTGRVTEDEQLFAQLKVLHDIDVPLEGLYHVTYMKFRFGRIPRDIFNHFYPVIKDRPDVFFFTTDIQKDYVYGMYMMPRAGADKVDALFTSLQFDRIRLSDRLTGSSEEAEQMISAELEENRTRIAVITKELSEIAARERDALSSALFFFRHISGAFEIRRYAARTEESFYLIGWIPETEFAKFERAFSRREDVTFILVEEEEQKALPEFTPPTKLKNNPVFRPFEPFVEMYGLPAYNEIDPTPLVALTYPLIFGVMFGDVGHAALLLLAGLLLWKLKGMWLGKALCYCAAGSAAFGFVYGSVFGEESLLPGFKVLHSSESIFTILRVTIYAGSALVALSVLLNIANGVRQRDFEKIFFGSASLTGLVLYAGVVFTVLPFLGFGTSPFPSVALTCMILLPTVVVFLKEPITHLCEKKPFHFEEGFGGFFISGFFELFDVFLSFITNSISFLRVGAYAIAHASLMAVVYNMAESPGGTRNIAVLVAGNLIVAGLEAVLVAIQVLRLEYYEIFGRFFSGAGKPYKPLNSETHQS